jgi:copper homeostasis protein
MAQKKYTIEIATSDFTTTKSAVEGGADRIELCANLSEGGTTPSFGTILQCRNAFDVSIYVMIRPRSGDFLYTEEEYEVMKKDVMIAKDLGCNGVVFGILDKEGNIDVDQTIRLIQIAYPLGVTFHRAFDRCNDPFKAMEQLIEIGCERILTSGQQPIAPDGIDLIASLNKRANNRITIMPGSGVRADNIKMLAQVTGCVEFHSSLRSEENSTMKFIHPAFKDSAESYKHPKINPAHVRALKNALG